MRIAICDDEQDDIDWLFEKIKKHDVTHEVVEFTSPEKLKNYVSESNPLDVLFLDVNLKSDNGFEIAQHLKMYKSNIYIAMVTVCNEYIYDCFDRVDWFAPKPVPEETVFKILNNAKAKLYPSTLIFKTERAKLTLHENEIMYLEVTRNTLHINTVADNHSIRMTLKSALEVLASSKQFVQIHNSYIINLAHYKTIKGTEISLKNGTKLALTRTYRQNFFDMISEFVSGA